jgi:hypothetical protein
LSEREAQDIICRVQPIDGIPNMFLAQYGIILPDQAAEQVFIPKVKGGGWKMKGISLIFKWK